MKMLFKACTALDLVGFANHRENVIICFEDSRLTSPVSFIQWYPKTITQRTMKNITISITSDYSIIYLISAT